MDVLIRDVNPVAVKKIDELAKKKQLSRNQYLKNYIETLAVLDELNRQEDRYIELTKLLSSLVEKNIVVLTQVEQLLAEVI